jgi:hypothetical protein
MTCRGGVLQMTQWGDTSHLQPGALDELAT